MAPALVLVSATVAFLFVGHATGGPREDAALAAVVKEGRVLWNKAWTEGGKSCAKCHDRGPNKMSAKRLNEFPKFDKALKSVVTGQVKINQMITKHCKGEALELGSKELTALEAYVKTR
jgi:cytochrome c